MKSFLRSFSSLPLNHSRRVVVSYKRKYVHKVLVNCLFKLAQEKVWLGEPQELEVRSLYHLYSLKTKSSRCHYVVMTRSETKLLVAIPAPVSRQSAVNIATATSKCSITFLLPYDQDSDVKTEQDNVSNIL